jgi:hypothetical protein
MAGEEERFRRITFARHSDLVSCWLRYLDLYHDSIMTQNAASFAPNENPTGQDYATQLQYRYVALAAGTAKALFDLACSGYYVQAYALCRHLLETWVQIVYTIARPDMAERWFDTKQGNHSFVPPKDTTMHREIAVNSKTIYLKPTLEMVIANINRMNDMAHPSPYTLGQTENSSGSGIKIGATYNPRLATGTLHEGAGAFRLILDAWSLVVNQSPEWVAELRAVSAVQRMATTSDPPT